MRRKLKSDYEPLAETEPSAVITYVDDDAAMHADGDRREHELDH